MKVSPSPSLLVLGGNLSQKPSADFFLSTVGQKVGHMSILKPITSTGECVTLVSLDQSIVHSLGLGRVLPCQNTLLPVLELN